jgi:hypothetical protein
MYEKRYRGGSPGIMLTHLMHLEDLLLNCGAEKLHRQSVRDSRNVMGMERALTPGDVPNMLVWY